MTEIRHALGDAARKLDDRTEAELLLQHSLGRSAGWLFAHADDVLTLAQERIYTALVERRVAGEPVAYIIGRRGFWSLDLDVTPATLIPRPETELLVEQALARLADDQPVRVLDLGTGSGAIALSIATERPLASVVATDASDAALDVAKNNARRLCVPNVAFAYGDWLMPLVGQRFDLIVSNPPYIEAADPHLAKGDLRFEPASALASGSDGLDDIRHIVRDASAHLSPGGWLLFEHGWNQGEPCRALLRQAGYTEVFTAMDLEQRERVSGGRR